MIWRDVRPFCTVIKCAAIFAALAVLAAPSLAEDVMFRTNDDSVVVEGRFVAYDGEIVTVVGKNGPLSFRVDGMVCVGQNCPDFEAYSPRLRMIGAARMADILMPPLIDAYALDQGFDIREDAQGFVLSRRDGTPELTVDLIVADADEAFSSFLAQNADVLLSVRELTSGELDSGRAAGLGRLGTAEQGRILALDALVPVSGAASGFSAITMADLTAAFAGQNETFQVSTAAEIDAQLDGFENRFMTPFGLSLSQSLDERDDLANLASTIATAKDGLSLMPYGQTRNAQPLALDGPCGLLSRADFLSLKTEDYPLTFPLFLYLPHRNRHPQIEAFLDWMRSPSAQLVIRRAGFVDLAAVPIPLADQGDRLAAAITYAGPEVPLGELQRLVRVLSPQVRMSSTFRFEPGSTRLDGQSRSNVMQLAQSVRDGRFGNKRLMFVGFSDGRGPADANRDLSAARAVAVQRAVEAALGGIFPDNVVFESEAFGEALPMACDDTIWGQQTNRRVELWVSTVN